MTNEPQQCETVRRRPQLRLLTSSSSVFSSSSFPSSGGLDVDDSDLEDSSDDDFCNRFFLGTDYGLLITFVEDHEDENKNPTAIIEETSEVCPASLPSYIRCQLEFCPDSHFPNVHPHARAPAALQDVTKLGGGGSGISVFSGKHPQLGDLVMKHGDYKDLKELFALATIEQQLHKRGSQEEHPGDDHISCAAAASDMCQRIPEFRMIYMSPHHFRKRGKELWGNLKTLLSTWSVYNLASLGGHHDSDSEKSKGGEDGDSQMNPEDDVDDNGMQPIKKFPPRLPRPITRNSQVFLGRSIRLYEGTEDKLSFELDRNCESLALIFPRDSIENVDSNTVKLKDDSYSSLKSIVKVLLPIMTDKLFKFTLGQKTIGGSVDGSTEKAQTGNLLLYEGKLNGPILDTLISHFIQVIEDLEQLTYPDEANVIDEVKSEIQRLEETDATANDISAITDSFVGNAIKKNFHTEKGRHSLLLQFGQQFREYRSPYGTNDHTDNVNDDRLVLTLEEEIPAKHLGNLLRAGALIGDTFENGSMEATAMNPYCWRNILQRAIMGSSVPTKHNELPPALRRIWTCGLTDAGIHNLFVAKDKLWFFDLGEPQFQSIPGFLTKFLFSFFHTLGMQEIDDRKLGTTWVRRFKPSRMTKGKLELTTETVELLPKAYDAFEVSLDRIVAEVFKNDDSIRWLLLQYVTLQLFSDAAFCLQRWQFKGGGRTRSLCNPNATQGIEKWLWRAVWDIYIACDINKQESWLRFNVEHPSWE